MIEDLWESPYYDERSGLEYDFYEWAEAFATDASVRMYEDLTSQIEKSITMSKSRNFFG